jgi:RNA polymerase sigma-70 factor (ECF subfamily)
MHQKWLLNLIKTCHEEGYRWARQCCGYQEDLCREVMQEVYLKILQGKASYHEKSTLRTWFFAVIRFTALDHLKRGPRMESIDQVGELLPVSNPEDSRTGELKIALRQLPDQQRKVLLLVFYHEMTLEEAAEVMGVAVGTVRQHYHRGKKKLYARLKHETHE